MNSAISFEHKYKLGDTVWIKAQADTYKKCRTCKNNNHRKTITKVIKSTVQRISITATLTSKPHEVNSVSYTLLMKHGNTATANEWQCHATKKEAATSGDCIPVYGVNL